MAIATFCGCMSLGFVLWSMSNINAWYLPFIASMSIQDQLNSLITFLILFNNLVPISLYLTLEVVKFTQAKLIENDLKMFHSAKKYRAFARTSALNEDLGQIAYVFSDKTGTLTRNHMTFKRVSIEGRVYASMHISTKPGKHRLPDYQNFTSTNPDTRARGTSKSRTNDRLLKGNMLIMHLKSKRPQAVAIRDTLRIMSVCHTVIPERHNSEHGVVLKYKAISADEEALVRGAFTYGYELEHRDAKTLGICALGDHQKFRILNTNEFSSRRAMMSMVVLTPEKELVLYCKGSDAVILDRLSSEQKQSSSLQATRNHLHYFAVNGLRTLALAKVALDLDFYQEWNARYQLALQGGADANTMENIASDIEKNLELVAVTAIEDQLQDQVADAIRTMTGAGIKFWMLTGDKVETAVNIGRSCSLISSDMRKLELTATSMDMIQDTLSTYYNKILDESYAMIIDGLAFEPILINPQLSKMFFEICSKCAVVIACRVTPRQKAAFVRGIRLLNGNKPTLAIGDGANDVQMLQEADIGVGIIGNEGMQAVRASDFAIGQFRYLSRLLLVHGTWSYRRVSKVILFSFYKNVTMVLTLLYYCMLTGYSGSSLYNAWLSSGWNVAFTFLPVITFGVLDRDLEVNIIMKFPKVYHRGQQRLLFNVKVFFRYMIVAIIHSVIAFGFCIGSATDEWIGDMSLLGTLINGCLVFLVNCKIALETRYWTLLHLAAILSSVILWFIFIFIYSSLELGDFYGMALVLFLNPLTWFSFIFVTCSVIGLELAWQFIKHELFPDPCDVAREIKQFDCIDDPDNQSVEADNNSNDELMPLNETPLHSSDPNGSAAVGSDLFMNSFAFSYPTLESATQRQEEKEFRERNRTQKRNRRSSTTSTARRDKSRSYHEEPVFIINGPTVEALAYLQQQVEEEESYAREMSTRNGSAANSFKKSKHKS